MDADYLSKNINAALAEALTSMAVASPEDKVEYLGRYLLQYVKRSKQKVETDRNSKLADELIQQAEIEEEHRRRAIAEKDGAIRQHESQFSAFLKSLETQTKSKQEAMDKIVHFIPKYFNIPASYIAVKKGSAEAGTETLHYLSASPGQEHVVGKKLPKPAEDAEGERLGISFEAFKVPEVPEEEPEPEPEPPAEGEEPLEDAVPVVKKPPPRPRLYCENTMREKKCKFFGIPKLGAYLAVPVSYDSLDHDQGCGAAPAPEEGAEVAPDSSPYAPNKLKAELIICADTIGSYRTFKDAEVEQFFQIGDAYVKVAERLETAMFHRHVEFMHHHKAHSENIPTILAPAADHEAAALAKVQAELTPDPSVENPAEPHEAYKPYKDAEALLNVWTAIIEHDHIGTTIKHLQEHVLPVVPIICDLFHCLGLLVDLPVADFVDVCGDSSWDRIRTHCLPHIHKAILAFKPSLIKKVTAEGTWESIKAKCEAKAVFEQSSYPPHLPVVLPLVFWLQKAIDAREKAVTYFKEAKEKILEIRE